jgi:hypothetical protein
MRSAYGACLGPATAAATSVPPLTIGEAAPVSPSPPMMIMAMAGVESREVCGALGLIKVVR